MYYEDHIKEAQGPLEVKPSAILDLVSSNQFMLYPQWLCHSFKGCALSLPLLSHLRVLWMLSCSGITAAVLLLEKCPVVTLGH